MNRFRTGWVPLVTLGVVVTCLRILGQPAAADVAGMGYLLAATIAFDRLPFRRHGSIARSR